MDTAVFAAAVERIGRVSMYEHVTSLRGLSSWADTGSVCTGVLGPEKTGSTGSSGRVSGAGPKVPSQRLQSLADRVVVIRGSIG